MTAASIVIAALALACAVIVGAMLIAMAVRPSFVADTRAKIDAQREANAAIRAAANEAPPA